METSLPVAVAPVAACPPEPAAADHRQPHATHTAAPPQVPAASAGAMPDMMSRSSRVAAARRTSGPSSHVQPSGADLMARLSLAPEAARAARHAARRRRHTKAARALRRRNEERDRTEDVSHMVQAAGVERQGEATVEADAADVTLEAAVVDAGVRGDAAVEYAW